MIFGQTLDGRAEQTDSGEEEMVKTVEINLSKRPAMTTTMKSIAQIREEAAREESRMKKELEHSKPDWLKELDVRQKEHDANAVARARR